MMSDNPKGSPLLSAPGTMSSGEACPSSSKECPREAIGESLIAKIVLTLTNKTSPT